jgi:hypothetical protein
MPNSPHSPPPPTQPRELLRRIAPPGRGNAPPRARDGVGEGGELNWRRPARSTKGSRGSQSRPPAPCQAAAIKPNLTPPFHTRANTSLSPVVPRRSTSLSLVGRSGGGTAWRLGECAGSLFSRLVGRPPGPSAAVGLCCLGRTSRVWQRGVLAEAWRGARRPSAFEDGRNADAGRASRT